MMGVHSAEGAATVTTLPNISVSADSFGGASVALGNIVLTEGAKADIGNGTLVLNAPSGFSFDTTAAVTVTVANAGGATLAISGSPATPTTTNITVTVSGSGGGGGGARSTVTWSGIRVRAANGTLPSSGNITKSGTATITGNPANFGTLTKIAGAINKLAFSSTPVTVKAGATSSSITVQRQDQFGNPVTAESTRTVTLASDSIGSVTFVPASPLSITNGSSTASFTYRDTKHGTPTITAASTSPSTISNGTKQITVDPAGIVTWNGNGANDAWSTGANWVGQLDAGASSTVHFAGATRLNPVNDLPDGTVLSSLYFDGDAGAFTLTGNEVGLTWVIENNSPNPQTVAMPIQLVEDKSVAIRTIAGSGDLTLSGVISGSGNLLKQVYSENVTKAILSGENTYSGRTEIYAGILSISSIKDIGSPEPSSLGMPLPENAVIRMNVGLASTLIYTGTGDSTDRGFEITGQGAVTFVQDGTGLLKFTGPISISHDSLHRINLFGTGEGEIANVISNSLSEKTRIVKAGEGSWTLCASNTYTGSTWIENGVLALCASGSVDHTSDIRIFESGTLDVSAHPVFNLGYRALLTGEGKGTDIGITAATIRGAPGSIIDIGSRPIEVRYSPASFLGDVDHPSLFISEGSLVLGTNVFTVNNISGSPLGFGTYRIIQQADGNITSSGSHEVSIIGDGVVTGAVFMIQVSGGDVNLVVSKVTHVTIWPTASNIQYGQTLADSLLSGGAASVFGTFTFTSPATMPNAGTANQSVTFTPDDPGLDPEVSEVSVTVEKATAPIYLLDLAQTYDGSPKSVTATTSPEGLIVEFTYNGSTTAPTAAGSYAVTGTVNDINYEGSSVGTLVIAKAVPVITIPPTASNIIYGQSLADSLLSGGAATVPGTFDFTVPSTTPDIGTASQSVTFTPEDTNNYESVIFDVDVTVEALPELAISSIHMNGNDMIVEWAGTNSWLYTLESTTMLDPGNTWTNYGDHVEVPGLDGVMSAVESNAVDTTRFFRVFMNK